MTDEYSYCKSCQTPITVTKTNTGSLQIKCDCQHRSIKVARGNPNGWVFK